MTTKPKQKRKSRCSVCRKAKTKNRNRYCRVGDCPFNDPDKLKPGSM